MADRSDRAPEPAGATEPTPDADASPRERARASRFVRLRRFGLEVGVIVLLFFGLGWWQTRGLLPSGEPMPAFDLVDLEGRRVSLEDYRGKTLLVHLWATWCGVCRREFDALNAINRNLEHDEALVTIVADSNDRARLARFVRDNQLEYPVLVGTRELLERYKVEAFPTNYYVDDAGMLRDKTVGLSTRLTMGARMACTK